MNHELWPSFIASHVDGRGSVWKCLVHRKQKAEKTFPDTEGLGCLLFQELLRCTGLSILLEIGITKMCRLLFSLFVLSFYWWGTLEKFMHRPWGKKEIHSEILKQLFKRSFKAIFFNVTQLTMPKLRTMSTRVTKSHFLWLNTIWLRFYFTFFFLLQKVHLFDDKVKST